MKKLLRRIWELIKLGLMLWGAFTALYVLVVIIHNATSKPTPPPGGWYPPEPGEEGYKEYLQKLENKKRLNGVNGLQ